MQDNRLITIAHSAEVIVLVCSVLYINHLCRMYCLQQMLKIELICKILMLLIQRAATKQALESKKNFNPENTARIKTQPVKICNIIFFPCVYLNSS